MPTEKLRCELRELVKSEWVSECVRACVCVGESEREGRGDYSNKVIERVSER